MRDGLDQRVLSFPPPTLPAGAFVFVAGRMRYSGPSEPGTVQLDPACLGGYGMGFVIGGSLIPSGVSIRKRALSSVSLLSGGVRGSRGVISRIHPGMLSSIIGDRCTGGSREVRHLLLLLDRCYDWLVS